MCLPAGPPLPRPLTSPPCILGGGTLRTCVLRPPGIYGPEEQRHLPRVAVCQPGSGPEAQDEPGCCGNGSGPLQPTVSLWSNIASLGLSSGRCPYPSGPTRNKGLHVHLPGLGIGRGVPELRSRRGRGSLWAPRGPERSAHAVSTRSSSRRPPSRVRCRPYSYEGLWAFSSDRSRPGQGNRRHSQGASAAGPVRRKEREYKSTAERADGRSRMVPVLWGKGRESEPRKCGGRGNVVQTSRQLGYKPGNEKGRCSGLCHTDQ